jgi:hypothetical protein
MSKALENPMSCVLRGFPDPHFVLEMCSHGPTLVIIPTMVRHGAAWRFGGRFVGTREGCGGSGMEDGSELGGKYIKGGVWMDSLKMSREVARVNMIKLMGEMDPSILGNG